MFKFQMLIGGSIEAQALAKAVTDFHYSLELDHQMASIVYHQVLLQLLEVFVLLQFRLAIDHLGLRKHEYGTLYLVLLRYYSLQKSLSQTCLQPMRFLLENALLEPD